MFLVRLSKNTNSLLFSFAIYLQIDYKKYIMTVIREKLLDLTVSVFERFTDAQEALTSKEGTLVDVKIVATKLVSTKVKLENDGENKTSSSEPKRQAS
jgi:hypothetical protein